MVHRCMNDNPLLTEQDEEVAGIAQALGHPIRIAILRALADGERCSCELGPCFDLDQSGISRHLAVLRRAGLIVSRRDGVRRVHRLGSSAVLQLIDWAQELVDQLGSP